MEEKSKNTFYLDPYYKTYIPRKSRLKWESIDRGNSKYADLKSNIGIYLGILMILFCLIGLYATAGSQFDAEGVNTTFAIIQCESLSLESSQVQVTYQYTVDNAIFSGMENSDANMTCDDFPIGTAIDGQYISTNPGTSRVTQDNFYSLWTDEDWGSSVLLVICLPLTISSLGLIRHLWLRRKYHLLRTEGILLDGEFLNFSLVTLKSGITLLIDYQYKTPDGRVLKNRFINNSGQLLMRKMPKVLTPIKVLYVNDKTVIML
jgi:hypothetical protein